MKKLLSMLAAGLLATGLSLSVAEACDGHDKKEDKVAKGAQAEAKQAKTATFRVDGMHCGSCADKIKAALAKIDGVVKVVVKTPDKRVVVDYDAAKLTPEKIAKIISDAGYKATPEA